MRLVLKFRNQVLWLVITSLIALAVFIGKSRAEESLMQLLQSNLSEYDLDLTPVNNNKWITEGNNGNLYLGSGLGYNGEVKVIIHVDSEGIIKKILPVYHQETPGYFKKIEKKLFFDRFTGKNISAFQKNQTVDVISGATITSNAIIDAIKTGYAKGENIQLTQNRVPVFGALEISIIFLFITGWLIVKIKSAKIKNFLRWISVVISLIFVGFIYNQPITYSRLTAFLLGNRPDFYKEIFFYILLTGSIVFILFTRKNVYCHSVCPFGAAQEMLAKTGKAKPFRPQQYKKLKFIQRGIALSVILVALALNNPVIANYEVFSPFFQLTANYILFGVLFIVIILSLFIKRPWCHFMCPIDSVFDYVKLTRKSFFGLWKK